MKHFLVLALFGLTLGCGQAVQNAAKPADSGAPKNAAAPANAPKAAPTALVYEVGVEGMT